MRNSLSAPRGANHAAAAALLALAALALLSGAAPSALAQTPVQEYPVRNITFIVPYAPGGNGDIRGRQVAQKLSVYFGKAVVVENKSGAGGNIGTDAIAKAAPDGYTDRYGQLCADVGQRRLVQEPAV